MLEALGDDALSMGRGRYAATLNPAQHLTPADARPSADLVQLESPGFAGTAELTHTHSGTACSLWQRH